MNLLGLIIFVAIMWFALRFAFGAIGHLFRVLGWIGSDISHTMSEAIEAASKVESRAAAEEEPAEEIDIAPRRRVVEITSDPLVKTIRLPDIEPRRRLQSETEDGAYIDLPIDVESAPHLKIQADPAIDQPPEPGEVLTRAEKVDYSFLEFGVHIGVVALSAITDLLITLIVFRRHAAIAIMDFMRKMSVAIRMPYPLRCSIWYIEALLCVLPVVIFMNVPDIHGYGPTLKALASAGYAYLGFVALIYLARGLVDFDAETAFHRADAAGLSAADAPLIVRARHLITAFAIFSASLLILYKLVVLGIFILGFAYSLLYFIVYSGAGDRTYTLGKFMKSWLIFAILTFAALLAAKFGIRSSSVSDYSIPIMLLIAFIIIHTLNVMSKVYSLDRGIKELPARGGFVTVFKFSSPIVKAAFAVPMTYFLILFFSVNTAAFAIGGLAACALFFARGRFRRALPAWLPGGVFAAYMTLVWISIFYVQTYNRVPPPQTACDSACESGDVRPIFTMKDFSANPYLKNSLPYDAAFDPDGAALFASFKNLSGYGAVLRLDAKTGKVMNHVVTENDRYPGKMFYPERFCIDRAKKRLYVTTKSTANFQLLSFDYSSGLNLDERIRFPEYETTNCKVDERNGDIYVIFLGPPYNHLRVVDAKTRREKSSLHFGRFGYADYFDMDMKTGRMVFPSLDPGNRFAMYDVENFRGRSFESRIKKVSVPFRFGGLLNAKFPLPTLGIAKDTRTGMLYFTSPFTRMLFEVDSKDFSVKRKISTGRFPREIAVNEKAGVIIAANYGDGTAHIIDLKTWKRLKIVKVGKLVRSVVVDPETGRTFIVSACGVFELRLDNL